MVNFLHQLTAKVFCLSVGSGQVVYSVFIQACLVRTAAACCWQCGYCVAENELTQPDGKCAGLKQA